MLNGQHITVMTTVVEGLSYPPSLDIVIPAVPDAFFTLCLKDTRS